MRHLTAVPRRLRAALTARLRNDDGGEGIQAIIIAAGLAVLAVAVVAAIAAAGDRFMAVINNLLPNG